MKQEYPNLLKPIRIGQVVLKNRMIAAPTGLMDLTPDGRLTPYNISYYELKARGGAAVVTLGESITESQTGQSHNRQICLDDPDSLPGLTHVVMGIQKNGALANIQLSHGGKYAGLSSIGGEETAGRVSYGPSDQVMPSGEVVHAMDREMIVHIVRAYGQAAKRCKIARFDMVMVHAGHGWLFNQFLSPLENKRNDEFGGSLENRGRFLMLALDEVRKAVGPGFPIQLRMNGDDFIKGAMSEEDYRKLAVMVQDKVDLINVSAGSHEAENLFVRTHPSMFLKHGCNVYLAEGIKKVVNIPVSCVGGINSPELAEEIIASGKADIVELARALLADPYFPKKVMAGEAEDITPCIRCFNCLASVVDSTIMECTVNPACGFEFDHKYYTPTLEKVKRIMVVGGGPGGMEAAITAAKKGHRVILCEKSDSLGGTLKFSEYVAFKEDLYKFVKVMKRRISREEIDVRLNMEVTKAHVKEIQPDVLIVATGSLPIVPPMKGVEDSNVYSAIDAERDFENLGHKIAIVGGGLVGCETGVHLGMSGKKVTIIEMRDELASESNRFHKIALNIELERYVTAMVNTTVKEITPAGVICQDQDGKEVLIEADSIILAVGVKANGEEAEELAGLTKEFYMIGDCVRPAQVMQAVQQGYYTSREL